MTIYVGNLNYKVNEEDLVELFTGFGDVKSVKIVIDNNTGRPRGFAFVEMAEDEAGTEAIKTLHEQDFMERALVVNQARPKTSSENRPRGGNEGDYEKRSGNGSGYSRNY